jgi:hypothetical protein
VGFSTPSHRTFMALRIAGDDRRGADIANQLNARRKIPEVFRVAHITMEKRYAVAREDRDISFAAAANEIVHDGNLVSRGAEMKSDVGTDKTATTGDKNVQEMILLQDHYGAGLVVPFLQRRKSR